MQPENSPTNGVDTLNINDVLNRIADIRDERRELANQDKQLKEEFDTLKSVVIAKLNEQGVTRASNDRITATLTKTLVPQVHDRSVVEQWIYDNEGLYLMKFELKAAAYRELLNAGTEIPGTSPFEKIDVNLRKAS
jgi:hypothetical protein